MSRNHVMLESNTCKRMRAKIMLILKGILLLDIGVCNCLPCHPDFVSGMLVPQHFTKTIRK